MQYRFHRFMSSLNRLLWGCACLLLLSSGGVLGKPTRARQPANTVPPPPTQRADKFGITNWNVDYGAYPGGSTLDRLNWGAEKVAALGSRTISVFLGEYNIYGVVPANATQLVEVAQAPAYDKLFRDARFKTYALTTYSRGAGESNWIDGFSAAEYNAEREEMRKLGEYLLSNPAFAGKTFILFNWEAEGAINYHENKDATWVAMREWHRARVEGVQLARQRYPQSQAKLFSGLSYVLVRSVKTGHPCGTPVTDPRVNDPLANRCAIDFIGPDVPFDYYGYSAWQSVNEKFDKPQADLKTIFNNDLNAALAYVKTKRPEVTASNFMLIEYSFERTRYGECAAANYLNEMFEAIDGPGTFPLSYAIWWQVIDNAPHFGYAVGDEYFGFYRTRNGQLERTLVGQAFQERIANQPVTRVTGCPLLRIGDPAGILDSLTHNTDFHLNPDSVLEAYVQGCCQNVPAPFSPSGNEVHFDQRTRKFLLPRDNANHFYESPTQINFSLPTQRRFGEARVWFRDANGRDSNFQHLHFRCDTCPEILGGCGVLEAEFQTYQISPGSTVLVNGKRFSPSGNRVVLEQQDLLQQVTRYVLPQANILSESTTQLKIKLPEQLASGLSIAIIVTDAQGRESNEGIFGLTPNCVGCLARVRPCEGIVKAEMTPDTNLYAGTRLLFRGRFPLSNQKLIVEQWDQTGKLYRHTVAAGSAGWQESEAQITATLPAALFPGRALIYFEDTQSRITRAYPLTISALPVTNVSAASFRGNAFAPGSIVAAFGSALATATQAATATPLPSTLNQTTVTLRDSAGSEHAAPLFFVSSTQINYQLPPTAALGAATLTIRNGYGATLTSALELVAVAPSLFAANATGRGLPAAVVVRVSANGTQTTEPVALYDRATNTYTAVPINLDNPAEQVFLVLFGTGFRNLPANAALSVTIGGVSATISYAGAQGILVGVDQLNVRLPNSLRGRGLVEIRFTAQGVAAEPLQVAIK